MYETKFRIFSIIFTKLELRVISSFKKAQFLCHSWPGPYFRFQIDGNSIFFLILMKALKHATHWVKKIVHLVKKVQDVRVQKFASLVSKPLLTRNCFQMSKGNLLWAMSPTRSLTEVSKTSFPFYLIQTGSVSIRFLILIRCFHVCILLSWKRFLPWSQS